MAKRQRAGTGDRLLGRVRTGDLNTGDWAAIDEGALSDKRRAQYLRRKTAVSMYLDGASAEAIRTSTGYSLSHAYRTLTERCLATHEDGRLWGWRGAVPNAHIRPYTRKSPLNPNVWGGGLVGALQKLFAGPGGMKLEQEFSARILASKRKAGLSEIGVSRQALYGWFIAQLREMGLEARGEWPFNVSRQGYVTVCKHIAAVLASNPKQATKVLGGPEAEKKAKAGDGTSRPELLVYQRVECDAHHTDVHCVVLVPSPAGGYEPVAVHRLWVIVIIEIRSRAVLGYHLSTRREPSAEDVLRAVKMALSLWKPRAIQFSDIAYNAGAGFPSFADNALLGACWDEFSVDGALSNICARVRAQLKDVVGARLVAPGEPGSYSSRRSLDDRPYIESYFRHLASRGLHRLSTTTGGNPKDKKGRNPVAEAARTQFQLEYLQELLDVFIANYNAHPHSGLATRSPLGQMRYLTSQKHAPVRLADPGMVSRLVCTRRRCRVVGAEGSGRRPHVNFLNARYSAQWLCNRLDLVNQMIWVHVDNEDDVRIVTTSTDGGVLLGSLMALPPWNVSPHTLYMRAAISSLHNRRLIHVTQNSDPIALLIDYAESSDRGKLPAHPAYLEARRIWQVHAEHQVGMSMIEHARDAGTETPCLASNEQTVREAPRTETDCHRTTAERAQASRIDPGPETLDLPPQPAASY